MTTQRQRTGNRLAVPKNSPVAKNYPVGRFPIQYEIQRLEDELNAVNERMAELEKDGHRGRAMDVLIANAIDFARRIDELRCVLVESDPKATTHKQNPSKS
jgi:hypothetical protein